MSGLFVWITRAPVRSQFLFSWDSVNFALALDRWDLVLHQPHPPGYVGYVWLARACRLMLPDPNAALILVGMLAMAASGFVWFRLALELDVRPLHAWAGLAVLLTSPLVWLYSSVAEVSALDMLCVLVVAAACLRARRVDVSPLALALAYAASAVVKLPTAVLMIPQTLTADRKRRLMAFSIAAGAVLATFGAMTWWEPRLPSLFWQQFMSGTEQSRLVGAKAPSFFRVLNANLRDTLQAAVMAGAALLLVLPYAIWRCTRTRSVERTWAVAWALPSVATFVFVHLGKPGYLLPLVPLACLYAAAGLGSNGRRGAVILWGIALVNVAQFLALAPLTGDSRRRGAQVRQQDRLAAPPDRPGADRLRDACNDSGGGPASRDRRARRAAGVSRRRRRAGLARRRDRLAPRHVLPARRQRGPARRGARSADRGDRPALRDQRRRTAAALALRRAVDRPRVRRQERHHRSS